MDTSETYVKMCDCEEVQKARDGTPEWYERDGTLLDIGDFHVQKSDNCVTIYTKHIRGRKKGAIWLPRQDQIQRMWCPTIEPWFGVILAFISWFETIDPDLYLSMEQLWLAFYIHKKHGQTWVGEKWV